MERKNGKITSQTVNIKDIDTVLPKDIDRNWNDDLKQNYVKYLKGDSIYKMWIEDANSIREKIGLVKKYKLAGTAAWEKDRESSDIWTVINKTLNS